MPEPTEDQTGQAAKLCDDLTFGQHSWDGAVSILAQALADARQQALEEMGEKMAQAEELAVFDFLQWLAPQNIELHKLIPGGCSEATDGELWERWKAERNA